MGADEMEALAVRCEQAEGPDRELDAAIWVTAVGRHFDDTMRRWYRVRRAWPVVNGGEDCFWFETRVSVRGTKAISYTASLDAALTLVPEGGGWEIAITVPGVGTGAQAQVYRPGDFPLGCGFQAVAVTPALSLCAASLRARATALRQPGGDDAKGVGR